jgi:formylglycine-generating enzyme required for sulfatase activity
VRFSQFIAATWLALVCALSPVRAEKRVALIVGNDAYAHADRLANPVNDARAMRDALMGLKFDVTYGEDLDGKALRRAIGRFNDRIGDADVALVYFAGHGATFNDVPYVVPVDAEFVSLAEMPAELVAVEDLIGELRRAKSVRIAILDACRDNGAEQELKRSRGSAPSRGLAPMKNSSGLIIAYATQAGATAADSAGSGNSPFTAALLHNITTPGLDVTDMFRKVGREVDAVTGGRQRPEISISMYEPYVLAPSEVTPEFASRPAPPDSLGNMPPSVGPAADEVAWSILKDTKDSDQLRRFITQFPGSRWRHDAEERLKALEQINVVMTVPVRPPKETPASNPCTGATTVSLMSRRAAAPLSAVEECSLNPKDSFRECKNCPEMVVVPAGSFTMGSPEREKDRRYDEDPQHTVTISKPLAVGKLHVTVDQFAAFVMETGYAASTNCPKLSTNENDGSWRDPGFAQKGSHPVICVSWDDTKAYVEWVTKKTGKPYRLFSEAEFEYAARGRTSPGAYPRFWFGDDEKDLCRNGNGADQKAPDSVGSSERRAPCNDGYAYTSPAGHYAPNAFGLYDMFGNAWQMTEDCYYDRYNRAPADGSAWIIGGCSNIRVIRGGSWQDPPRFLRAAGRIWNDSKASSTVGFRLARTLTP